MLVRDMYISKNLNANELSVSVMALMVQTLNIRKKHISFVGQTTLENLLILYSAYKVESTYIAYKYIHKPNFFYYHSLDAFTLLSHTKDVTGTKTICPSVHSSPSSLSGNGGISSIIITSIQHRHPHSSEAKGGHVVK